MPNIPKPISPLNRPLVFQQQQFGSFEASLKGRTINLIAIYCLKVKLKNQKFKKSKKRVAFKENINYVNCEIDFALLG